MELKKYNLQNVNIFDGKAAILFEEKRTESSMIDITLKYDRINIRVAPENRKKAKDMINQLSRLVSGSNKKVTANAISGIEDLADTLKETFDAVKNSFGFAPKMTVAYCKSCGAGIEGNKGNVVKCQYCGSLIEL